MSVKASKKIPKELIDILAAKEAIGIVGAGCSVAAGFPSWRSLLGLLISECEEQVSGFSDAPELKRLLRDGRYTIVADACVKALRGSRYREFMQRVFRPAQVKPTILHRQIFRLPLVGILTTNYDTLLEQEYVRVNKALSVAPVYTQKNVAQLARLASNRNFFIFKAHGHIDDPETIVLTQKDYQDLLHQNGAYRAALSALFATKSMVFFGYGLQDPDLNLLLGQQVSLFRGYGRRHFAFVPDPGRAESESFAEHYNIEVIAYSSKNGHRELAALVEQLVKRTEQRTKNAGLEEEVRKASLKRSLSRREKIREVMEFERRICGHLQGYIELERARFLKLHAKEARFAQEDLALIDQSIAHWEKQRLELAELEGQLRQSQKMEALGLLAGGIAHDFNNILVAIEGYRALAAEIIPQDSPAQKHLSEAEKACVRATDLIRQILVFARGDDTHDRELIDMAVVVSESVQLLKCSTISKNVTLEWSSANCSAIKASRSQMSQVVMNILINAVQAIDENPGKIVVSLDQLTPGSHEVSALTIADGAYLRLKIVDNGPGISPENLKRIFEPFFTTKGPNKGTGLGLSVVHGIVTDHNGAVTAESKMGEGATFSVFLPIDNKETLPSSSIQEAVQLGDGRRILLVDDEPSVLEVTAHYLKQLGFEVRGFSSPSEALKEFGQNSELYDLVLTDQVMPEVNGLEFCAKVRAINKDIPAVLMSGYRFDASNARRVGITDMMPKPYTKAEFARSIFRALSAAG
jgi:signal transduction histidine kinase/ActR/RegA family two-component response regulator